MEHNKFMRSTLENDQISYLQANKPADSFASLSWLLQVQGGA